ncbi:MAG: ABC transporter ATP-binding protein [Lachnospiraceae bacterium]|nr:ABC transporter ATP-binding protein [Lachnospiraceae bacterium]
MENMIGIRNLTKRYGKKRGVEDVSFEVQKGEIFGFIGPNGAGKSTTIRSMLGFIRFDSGSISILGMDAVKDHEKILEKVGYMPSEALFYPGMKVSEVIRYAADVRGKDCGQEAAKLCERLEVDTSKKIRELSLGNRKKVSIVCAMQHRPELFIFDEPTGGLDPLVQNTFFELIKEYVKEGATCLLSTHILPEVRKHCDRAAIMREGHLIKTDTVENLIRSTAKSVKVTVDGRTEEYMYNGDLNDLIGELSKRHLENLSITDPSLEDMFMHFYEGGKEKS